MLCANAKQAIPQPNSNSCVILLRMFMSVDLLFIYARGVAISIRKCEEQESVDGPARVIYWSIILTLNYMGES